MCLTACMVVQVVVKASSHSDGNGKILTLHSSKTLERISVKRGSYVCCRYVNPAGAVTVWMASANT